MCDVHTHIRQTECDCDKTDTDFTVPRRRVWVEDVR